MIVISTQFTLDFSPLVLGFSGKRNLDDEALDAGRKETKGVALEMMP